MLCDEPPADGYNFAVGEVVHIAYLGDLSIYHVRLKSGQMLSAQLQNEHRYRKGQPTLGRRSEPLLGCGQLRSPDGIRSGHEYT